MRQNLTILDWLVLIATALIIASSLGILFLGQQARPWLLDHRLLLTCTALLMCILLATWMLAGGNESKLWAWMPPYCMFPAVNWIRWLVVGAMILGTVIGMVKTGRLQTP